MRINRFPFVSIVAFLAIPAGLTAQVSSGPETRLRADVTWLAADARQGRGVGTEGLAAAARYIAARFAEVGLHPVEGDDDFLHPFTISPSAPAAAHAGVGGEEVANVVGVFPGTGAFRNQTVFVGAHYDHLGLGGFGSLDPDSVHVVHNGADDNASGTAAMIEVARQLVQRADQTGSRRTIVFVAFTGEELGLLGSDHFVEEFAASPDATLAMVNMDMVGRLSEGKLAAFGAETATEFPTLLDSLNQSYHFELAASGDGYGRSDQQSFYAKDIPVLHFFSGTHEDYHRTTDDAERINYEGLARIAGFVADLTWNLATREGSLTFVDAEPPQQQVAGGYGAYLGTIPDMTESPDGVRLTGVRAGSPAEQAGIMAGDVIIAIGDIEVNDLYDMTDALRSFRPGDTTVIRVRRQDQEVELSATFGSRG